MGGKLDAASARLAAARRIAVLTGAGISAESGIPTFRDAMTGLWARFRPEDLATPEAFAANPKRVWNWYAARREGLARATPNAGHAALVELERRAPRFALITQNVDGLHARAGSRRVIELHGNLMEDRCFAEGRVLTPSEQRPGIPPRCAHCGAPVRPGVVWFGEALPAKALDDAYAEARGCDVFLSVGTSTVVEPAASLPFVALDAGAAVIEVNPTRTPLSAHATIVLTGAAGEILPRLVRLASSDARRPSTG
jgi:NAD-dependent protein deacetylase/lipoamidase